MKNYSEKEELVNLTGIEEKIFNIIKSMDEFSNCTDEEILFANYEESSILDSVSFITLVVMLEESLSIFIDDENLSIEKLSSFASIVGMIKQII